MSYPQPRPAFPDSAFPQAAPQPWQPSQPAAGAGLNFYSPPIPQQQQQPQQQQHGGYPQQSSPPQPAYGDAWQADNGARQRPVVPSHHGGGGSLDGSGQVAFMPSQMSQVMNNPMAGMALDLGKASFAKNLSWVMSFLSALKYYFHVSPPWLQRANQPRLSFAIYRSLCCRLAFVR